MLEEVNMNKIVVSKEVPTYKDLLEIVDVLKSLSRSRNKMDQDILHLQKEVRTLKEEMRKGVGVYEDTKTLF